MDFGKALKLIRKEIGFTGVDLAIKCGLSTNTINNIESGKVFPSKESIKKICKALDVPVAYVVFFSIQDEDMPEASRTLYNALRKPLEDILLENIKTKR